MTCFSRTTRKLILWRYVYPSELKTFESIAARQRILSTGRIGRSWASNYTSASRLPLHPSLGPPNTPYPSVSSELHIQKEGKVGEYGSEDPMSHAALSFVHGGLSPTYPDLSPFPTRINALSQSLLAKLQHRQQPPPHPPNPYPGLPSRMSLRHQTSVCIHSHVYSKMQPQKKKGFMDLMVHYGTADGQMKTRKRYARKSIRYWLRLAREGW